MKNMSHKTNKKMSRRNKRSRRNKQNKINKQGKRNKFSRRNKRQRGGNYNAEQIQEIIDTIKANANLNDITDEEITQFINKINPNAALYANIGRLAHLRLSPMFIRLIEVIQHIQPNHGVTAREWLQRLGDTIAFSSDHANFTDGESDPEN
jgi:hypothetical protein